MAHVGVQGRTKWAYAAPEVAAVWRDGVWTGSLVIQYAVEEIARQRDGFPVGPPNGPFTYTTAEHLASGLSVAVLLMEIMEPTARYSDGDIACPGIPADAVG